MSVTYRPSDRLACVAADDCLYLATVPHGPIVVLEGTAAVVWHLAQDCPVAELAARVATHFDLPVDQAGTDIHALVRDLVAAGLLVAALND